MLRRVAVFRTQFRKTSEMFGSINASRHEERQQWVTKSTADFAERVKIAQSAGLKIPKNARPNVTTLLTKKETPKAAPGDSDPFSSFTPSSTKQFQQKQQKQKLTTSIVDMPSMDPTGKSTLEKKATQEYAEAAAAHANAETKISEHKEEFDRMSYEHWDRIRSFKAARQGRWKDYFVRYGWGLFTWYCFMYCFTFACLYLMLKVRFLDYRGMFEWIYCVAVGTVDRPKFFESIEGTNPHYLDLSFTFALNELFDVWRLPFVFFTFMIIKNWWSRIPHKTIFRDLMPEKAIEFETKRRTGTRKNAMMGSGGTASSAAAPGVRKPPMDPTNPPAAF